MKPFKSFAEKFPWLYALLGIAAAWCAVKIPRTLLGAYTAESPQKELLMGISELIAAVFVFVVFGLFTGFDRLKYSGRNMKYGFRFMRVMLIVMAVFFIGGSVINVVRSGYAPVWQKIAAFFLLLTVGIVEEFTYRGMVFGGLLKKYGKTYRGILLAGLISGLLFGFMHVVGNAVQGELKDASTIAQAVGKTVSGGMFGFVLAVIYLKTRNIWVTVLLHSVYDGIQFVTSYVLTTPESTASTLTQYVVSGDMGRINVAANIVLIVILIPYFIKALKELKKESCPVPWPLEDAWYEQNDGIAGTEAK